jgi:1-acyl-sn-glycerol-3-phosphate acyltransferase
MLAAIWGGHICGSTKSTSNCVAKIIWPKDHVCLFQITSTIETFFIIAQMVPKRTVSIGKKVIRLFPIFGQLYWLSGNILINRKKKKSAKGVMSNAAQEMNRRNLSVWIMAEGTRSKGRGILPFKKGAFFTAIQAKRPIVPIAISQYHKTLDTSRWNSGKVIMQVLPPYPHRSLNRK